MAVKEEPVDAHVPPPKPKAKARSGPQKQTQDDPSAEGYKKAKKAMWDFRKATSWQVHRWPLEKRIIEERTKVHLPRTYRTQAGEDVKTVWAGADINQLVHQHYMQTVDLAKMPEQIANYVSDELGVIPGRHEFLGPDPRVAGYFFDVDGEIHVKWWDSFLQVQWMDKSTWTFDIVLSDDGKWVEKED